MKSIIGNKFGVTANIGILPPSELRTENALEIAGVAYAKEGETIDEGLKRYLGDVALGNKLPGIILDKKGGKEI